MKEKKNIILLIIAIILFLVALIFLVWSTKQKNIDNTNINNTNEILEENIEPQREIESSNTQDVEGVSYQDISIYTEDETQVKLSEFSEQPVMILFWNPENEDSVEVLKKVN